MIKISRYLIQTLVISLVFFNIPAQAVVPYLDFYKTLKRLELSLTPEVLVVTMDSQTLAFFRNGLLLKSYKISTSKFGAGELEGSYKTPLGLHRIADKIGQGAPSGTIFYARHNSGKVFNPFNKQLKKDDLVLTRILWLAGMEEGINAGVNSSGALVDSFQRYIYIHGTNHEESLGKPVSNGCIRMSSKDVIDLFDEVPIGTLVWITDPLSS